MARSQALDLHKALADETRFRLYRYVGLAGRPVSVREMSRRLSLHPNTLRPQLRRLEEAGLIEREIRKTAAVGRPQTLYSIRQVQDQPEGDYRLLAEMLCGLVRGKRQLEAAHGLARRWGEYLVGQDRPKPGVRLPAGWSLAVLRDGLARAGFDPRFRRLKSGRATIEVTLRDCPFRDLAEEHRELVCTLHRGLIEGMMSALDPPLSIRDFQPFVDRTTCRVSAG